MEIRKTYHDINPALLYDEIKEFVQRQGLTLDQNRLETYSIPTDSSTFIYRGTLTFKSKGQEALRAHIVGVDKAQTRLMLTSNEELFSKNQIDDLEDDLNFMLGPFESRE